MKLVNAKEHRAEKELHHFRSEVRSSVVGTTTLKSTAFTGLGADGAKVSEFALEQFLNACSPTCHG